MMAQSSVKGTGVIYFNSQLIAKKRFWKNDTEKKKKYIGNVDIWIFTNGKRKRKQVNNR